MTAPHPFTVAVAAAAGIAPEAVLARTRKTKFDPAADARMALVSLLDAKGARQCQIERIMGRTSSTVQSAILRLERMHRTPRGDRIADIAARAALLLREEDVAAIAAEKRAERRGRPPAEPKVPPPTPAPRAPASDWARRARDLRRRGWTVAGISKQVKKPLAEVAAAIGEPVA